MIRVKKLCKSFSGHEVLRDLSIEIPREKLSVILGASGCGKSVFLKHIIGLIRPDSGSIKVDGLEMTGMSERELVLLRKKFGMLFQNGALFDSLNVAENVAFPLREHTRLQEKEIFGRVGERLERVGLADAMYKMPSELSGGMRKRVGLARALALDPQIILYDEPTTGLDPIMTESINDLILQTQRDLKVTSVVISHDIESTLRYADFVAMLHEGRFLFSGTPSELARFDHPHVKEFLKVRTRGFV